jgi:serine protease Do
MRLFLFSITTILITLAAHLASPLNGDANSIPIAALTATNCESEHAVCDHHENTADSPCLASSNHTYGQLAAGDQSEPIKLNDKQISAFIEVTATSLIKKNKTTKTTELHKNLANKKCELVLAKPGKKKQQAHEVYKQTRSSVAIVAGVYKCGKCTRWHPAPASGFVISKDGALVTNYHVIENKTRETFVAYVDNKVYPVKKVLAASKNNDVAILQLDLPKGVELKPIAIQPNAPVGSDAIVISHPDRRYFSLTRGIVSRYFHMDKKSARNVPMMAITADYAKGSSGGPVLNDKGAVIGIVSSTSSVYYSTAKNGTKENLQMVFKQCVPAASLMKLIDNK